MPHYTAYAHLMLIVDLSLIKIIGMFWTFDILYFMEVLQFCTSCTPQITPPRMMYLWKCFSKFCFVLKYFQYSFVSSSFVFARFVAVFVHFILCICIFLILYLCLPGSSYFPPAGTREGNMNCLLIPTILSTLVIVCIIIIVILIIFVVKKMS